MGRPPKEKERKPFDKEKYTDIITAVTDDISKNPRLYEFPEFSKNPNKGLTLKEYLSLGGPSQAPMNAVSYMQIRYKEKLEEANAHPLEAYRIARIILGLDK